MSGPCSNEPVKPLRLFLAFLRLGAVAFGGPASIARIRDLAVVERGWLAQAEFEQGLVLCQMLPGATAMQCAAFIGLRLGGLPGAVAAFLGFGMPAFLVMLAASVAYVHALPLLDVPWLMGGLRLAVVAVVAHATLAFARAQIKTSVDALVVVVAAALFLLQAQPVSVVLGAVLMGMLLPRGPTATVLPPVQIQARQSAWRLAVVLGSGGCALVGLALLSPWLGSLALAMMKIDVTAFGGGFAALPLMYDEFVRSRGAVSALALTDGVALGQITPGPIVITATFIGYIVARLPGAVAATAGIFLPSFTLVIALAPCFGHLQRYGRVRAATRTAALAFVGLLVSATWQIGRSVPWHFMHVVMAAGVLLALHRKLNIILIMASAALAEFILARFGS
jgi:chromate transporter